MFTDYYELLGVNKAANSEEITSAFRREIMKYHPDRNMGNGNPERTRLLIEAKLILLDTEARTKYDKEHRQYNTFVNYSQTSNQEYEIQDEQLGKWIENAKRQAKSVYKEILDEFKESAKASFKGLKESAVSCLIVFIVVLIFKTCSYSNQSNSENYITPTKQIDETILPAIIPIDTFENENLYKVYMIKNVGYISIPNNMELQSGNYKKVTDNELKQNAHKYHYLVADNRVAFREKGTNDDVSKRHSSYAGITIQTFFGDCMAQTDDYSFTPEELSKIDALFKQQVKELSIKTGFLFEWKGSTIVKINNSTAIKSSYIRRIENGHNVYVIMYQFPNNDRLHQIILSYKQGEGRVWKPLFSEVVNSFNLTNIK